MLLNEHDILLQTHSKRNDEDDDQHHSCYLNLHLMYLCRYMAHSEVFPINFVIVCNCLVITLIAQKRS